MASIRGYGFVIAGDLEQKEGTGFLEWCAEQDRKREERDALRATKKAAKAERKAQAMTAKAE